MKKIIAAGIVLGFLSCEQIEKIDKQMDADSTDIANEIADIKAQQEGDNARKVKSELLFKAVGSEPGWYAECHTDKFRMLMNYGKDSIILFQNFPVNNGFTFSYNISDNGNTIHLNFKVEDKECTDDAGGKNPNTVTVTFNDQVFTGCGMPVK